MTLFGGRRLRLILLAMGLLAGLAALAAGINDAWASGLDTWVLDWFDAHRTARRDREDGRLFAYLGRPTHVLVTALVCGAALSARWRSPLPVALITGAVGVGVVVEQTLKAVIGRTATDLPLAHYAHSYPSGHVTGAAALLGSIAVCLGIGLGWAARAALAGLVSVCVVVVAFLALYIGAHTLTDVVGGMLLGGAIVALCAAAASGSRWREPAPGGGRRAAGAKHSSR